MIYTTGTVVSLVSPHACQRYANGEYAILKCDKNQVSMVQLKNGEPEKYRNGNYMITGCHPNFPGLTATGRTIEINKKLI